MTAEARDVVAAPVLPPSLEPPVTAAVAPPTTGRLLSDPPPVSAPILPPGFEDTVAISGLNQPTQVAFAPDGRVFIAEKSGIIKVFDSLTAITPTIFADLRTNVFNFWDRGLLSIALDPQFPTRPYVYALYSYDGTDTEPAPRWGVIDATDDVCPNPPGANNLGCVTTGRLSKLTANGNRMTGSEQVLIQSWCNQFVTHSVGDLVFGPDGALYVSAGDGAGFTFLDYGQRGNPCGDPPFSAGVSLTLPSALGGALRAQSVYAGRAPAAL
ncbi:MAG: PQQ-dependent sugar dehydrogenase, partial [Dehalococcoidia bacterium]|nr:PQQ-dependent sugar dehydrogenase [Dehalococcoidia bacterium]